MEQLENEQTENEAQTVGTENIEEGAGTREFSFKKFKTVESLQKAYSSLESEFTKRSQRLKELQGERDELQRRLEQRSDPSEPSSTPRAGYAALGKFVRKHPMAGGHIERLAEISAAGGGDAEVAEAYAEELERTLEKERERASSEEYLYSQIDNSPIKDRIIREYLAGIKNAAAEARTVALGGGEITLAPPVKPRTVEEAGRLAQSVLERKN